MYNYTDDAGTVLDSCIIENAINGVYFQSSSPTIKNSTFRNNDYGLFCDNGSAPTITGNTFTENNIPISILAHRIDGNLSGNQYFDNDNDYIHVYGDQDNGSWVRLWDGKTYNWSIACARYYLDS